MGQAIEITRLDLSAAALRSEDGGRHWKSVEENLVELRLSRGRPSTRSGDALSAAAQRRHARPLRARRQGCRLATRDCGETWEGCGRACRKRTRSLVYCGRRWRLIRLNRQGVYFGTNTGSLFASADEGDSWSCIAQHLPAIRPSRR